jgi:anti-sigma B factor antagonist/stage II sporulation protein AA (anti-sigma F factor antagonist)
MADAATLEIARDAQGAVHARLAGELDMASAPEVRARLYEALGEGAHDLSLDLSGLTFMDSAGVELLFRVRGDLAMRQIVLRLYVPADAPIRRTLEVTDGGTDLLALAE